MNNILEADLSFKGRDVYVVGSGPNGNGHYERVPITTDITIRNPHVITVNKGECIRDWGLFHFWLCVTEALLREAWFHKLVYAYYDEGGFEPVFMQGPLTKAFPDMPYTFARGRDLDIGTMGIEQGKLRRGAGTVGVALQLAQQLGAERCILVGVDMHGKDYFDGTRNENKSSIGPDGTWSQIAMLQRLINCLKQGGMDVVSLSKTKLGVEVI